MAQKETAAPAGTGNGGNIIKTSPNHYNAPAAHKQPTPRYFLNGRGGGHG